MFVKHRDRGSCVSDIVSFCRHTRALDFAEERAAVVIWPTDVEICLTGAAVSKNATAGHILCFITLRKGRCSNDGKPSSRHEQSSQSQRQIKLGTASTEIVVLFRTVASKYTSTGHILFVFTLEGKCCSNGEIDFGRW